jgi:hypothetical protein
VEKTILADLWDAPKETQDGHKSAKYAADNAAMREIVIEEIKRAGTQAPLSTEQVENALRIKTFTERPIRNLLKLLKREKRDGEERYVIEEQSELTRNAKGELVRKPRGATYLFTPELKDAYLRQWGVCNA